ncbi:MAG: alpha/beta fold hydrolase [Patescibacteria group bacterium]
MTVLILHGIEGKAGDHWEQWLHDQLIGKGYTVIMPNLPHSEHPDRATWLNVIKKSLEDVPLEELVIVGHSLGVTAALDFIEQASGNVEALVSISGFAYDYGSDLNNYYLGKKDIDFTKVHKHLKQSFILYGDNDPYVPQEVLQNLSKSLDVVPTVIPQGGHLNTSAGFTSFPALLQLIDSL